jgi:hypothetical protein
MWAVIHLSIFAALLAFWHPVLWSLWWCVRAFPLAVTVFFGIDGLRLGLFGSDVEVRESVVGPEDSN